MIPKEIKLGGYKYKFKKKKRKKKKKRIPRYMLKL